MTINLPLSPPLEQLVREQLATGRFQDASEVVAAALRLLGEQPMPHAMTSNLDAAFGLWQGRFSDGLIYERTLRAEWGM